ncbi:hypothetical protein FOMPIDRAFT_92084 [Fomitopsis schrenkii]|uniref:Uncharacterized protein n=1 Tax=Fomitopsis schrenkii TaxID=2126942 RepID=S8DYF8_FOMSC|nr:hypothetical protein FOMPIDRAFT_92084 [Fomitopsis schrenkii]
MDRGMTTATTETQQREAGMQLQLALAGRTNTHARRLSEGSLPPPSSLSHPRSSSSPPAPAANVNGTTDSRPRMRGQMTIDLPPTGAPFELLYDHKPPFEDHSPSPKPCIVPGNALHLIDDDPSPRSQTPSSVIILADGAEIHVDGSRAPATDPSDRSSSEPPPAARPQPRVRFRSRVRITSGVHRYRTSGTPAPQGQRPLSSGTPSSGSSPSSSISAPLRYQADDNATWGPLGRRLSALAAAGRRRPVQAAPQYEEEGPGRPSAHTGANERTALLRSSRHAGYVNPYESHLQEGDVNDMEGGLRAAEIRRQKELVFGPWPGRLFNLHWWWWHIEPIVCCTYCSEDCDYDE